MKLRIAIIGCGGICKQYGEHIKKYPEDLEIAGASDLDLERAAGFCAEYGGKVYENFEAILADPEVDLVLNLTIHHVHFDLNSRALRAGKHVYSEKPMALTFAQAVELCELAKSTGRRLAAAPGTYMSEGVQTAARFLEQEKELLGPVRLVYAEVNWGQINRWIGSPAAYFSVGPLLDVGVYAITALTYLLGPVRKVWGYSTILQTPRKDKNGNDFEVTAPDFTTGMLEFESGIVARITTNYYVRTSNLKHLRGIEFHGDHGSFILGDYHDFNGTCRYIGYNDPERIIPPLREGAPRMDRAVGLVDLAHAIRDNRPHRASAEHSAHVIEVMEGLRVAADRGESVAIKSCFVQQPLMEWAQKLSVTVPELPLNP